MTKNLFIALWPVDGFSPGIAQLTAGAKLDMLGDALARAVNFLAAAAARVNVPKPLMLFAVPEYYFIKDNAPATQQLTLFDEREKSDIYAGLKNISKAHPNVILVAGTVTWQKRRRTPGGSNQDRNYDGYNTAPIFFKGSLHHEYHKIADDGNFGSRTRDVVFTGGGKSQLFKVDGISFGIEVCKDFDDGNLHSEAGDKRVDMEVYISGYNKHGFDSNNIGRVPVRDGGGFIHCEAGGKADRVGVWLIRRGAGTHGRSLMTGGSIFDPWTCRRVTGDPQGMSLSIGMVLRITSPENYKPVKLLGSAVPSTQPVALPRRGSFSETTTAPQPPFLDRRNSLTGPMSSQAPRESVDATLVIGEIQPQLPGMDRDGNLRLTIPASFNLRVGADRSALMNIPLTFATTAGTLSTTRSMTNAEGKAESVLTINRSQTAEVTVHCFGATAKCIVAFETLGAGNISKMGQLVGNDEPDLCCWHFLL